MLLSWVWWDYAFNPLCGRLRLEDLEVQRQSWLHSKFQAILNYLARLFLKKTKQ
jgi:hypothetical protein